MEKKLDSIIMEKVCRRGGFLNGIDVAIEGTMGGLILGWKSDINVSLRSYSSNYVDMVLKGPEDEVHWRLTDFYGLPDLRYRDDS